MFDQEDEDHYEKPYIPEHATITVTDNRGDSVPVHTSELTLQSDSGISDPQEVGTRYEYASDPLGLEGEPVVYLDVIQNFDGGCRYVNGNIRDSVTVTGEAPAGWYSFDIRLDTLD